MIEELSVPLFLRGKLQKQRAGFFFWIPQKFMREYYTLGGSKSTPWCETVFSHHGCGSLSLGHIADGSRESHK
jgi:hypothetical protein